MPPPIFADLGRHCAALFNNGYPLGLLKVDTNIKTCGNVNLNTGFGIKQEDWSMGSAELNTKCTLNPPRIKTSVFESWDLDNNLKLGIVCEDLASYVPGIRLAGHGSLNPDTGLFSGKVNAQAKHNYTSVDVTYEGGDDKPHTVQGSLVAGLAGWLIGYKTNYDINEGQMTTPTLALGFCQPTYQIHAFWDNWESYRLNMYHRINDRVEAGVLTTWKPGNPPPPPGEKGESAGIGKPASETGNNIAVGCRMLLTPSTFLRAKIDIDSQVGLGIESKIREGTTLTLATNID
ncbi:unnamed protein product, partial [Allacma fusca]